MPFRKIHAFLLYQVFLPSYQIIISFLLKIFCSILLDYLLVLEIFEHQVMQFYSFQPLIQLLLQQEPQLYELSPIFIPLHILSLFSPLSFWHLLIFFKLPLPFSISPLLFCHPFIPLLVYLSIVIFLILDFLLPLIPSTHLPLLFIVPLIFVYFHLKPTAYYLLNLTFFIYISIFSS